MDPFAAFLFGAALVFAITASVAFVWWMIEHTKRLTLEAELARIAPKLDELERAHAMAEKQNAALIMKLHQMDGHIHHLHHKLASGGIPHSCDQTGVFADDEDEEISGLN